MVRLSRVLLLRASVKALVSAIAVGSAGTSFAALSDGLELYYSFDADTVATGGFLDASGNDRHGSGFDDDLSTTIDLGFSTDVPAALGSGMALDLQGTLDFVDSDTPGYTGVIGSGARTVAAWVKVTTQTSAMTLMEWGVNTNEQRWAFRINGPGAATQGTVDALRIEVAGGYIIGTDIVNDGAWHHVAATFSDDGTPDVEDVLLYVDGNLQTISGSGARPINTNGTANVTVGSSRYFTDDRSIDGLMADVAVWSRALSAQEIADLAAGVPIIATAIPGDTDGDGDVDDADLGTSFANYTGPGGTGKTVADGDVDGDGDVDDGDLGTSFANYTGPLGPAVPEPASLALLGLGGLLVSRRHR